jgi:hypothetical protein
MELLITILQLREIELSRLIGNESDLVPLPGEGSERVSIQRRLSSGTVASGQGAIGAGRLAISTGAARIPAPRANPRSGRKALRSKSERHSSSPPVDSRSHTADSVDLARSRIECRTFLPVALSKSQLEQRIGVSRIQRNPQAMASSRCSAHRSLTKTIRNARSMPLSSCRTIFAAIRRSCARPAIRRSRPASA